MQISCVIITLNEEKNIKKCILSVQAVVDEVVVVDSLSTDRTREICESLGVRFIEHGWEGMIEQKNWAEHLIQKVGIWEQRNQKPSEMSGGECQRTAVVRALVNKPELILADEPTGALDEENANALSELLIQLSEEEKVTLVTVTHSSELAGLMNKKYLLRNGKLEKE